MHTPQALAAEAAPGADGASGPNGSLTGARRTRWIAATVAVLVVIDQITKWWARAALVDEEIHLFWTLHLNLAFNRGTAFSAFEGWGQLIGVLAIIVILVLLRASRSVADRWGALAMGMVLGGAVGNLVDRVVQPGPGLFGGPVTDFFDLRWWPIFNVADIGITVGGVLLVLASMRSDRTSERPSEGSDDAASAR